MDALPIDVWNNIFSFFSGDELTRLSRVSKTFKGKVEFFLNNSTSSNNWQQKVLEDFGENAPLPVNST